MAIINQGFIPKREKNDRLPPGQYETSDFPVLSLGPTPRIEARSWKLEVRGLAEPIAWSSDEFMKLPHENVVQDIHCVTKWSKFDTRWEGVSLDTIMKIADVRPEATHLIAHSYDGYSTNMPLEDVRGSKAWIAVKYEGEPISPEHGGPARLLIPHLYFWKSAKWVNALEFRDEDEPGFWETRGYHNYGDPWREQRYTYD